MTLAAFEPAAQYTRNGIDAVLQTKDPWETHHDLVASLHQCLADVAWCTGLPRESETVVKTLLAHSKNAKETFLATKTLVQALGSQKQPGKLREAIELDVQMLREFRVFPRNVLRVPTALSLLMKLKGRLKKTHVNEVQNLPECKDERIISAMKVLSLLFSHATFLGDDIFQVLAIVTNVKLAFEHGVHKACVPAFLKWVS